MSGDEQIISRFMIEQLQFHGIRDAAEAATCLAGYAAARYPEGSGPRFIEFFLRKCFEAGLRLADHGADLWTPFVRTHASASVGRYAADSDDYFTRAIQSLLPEGRRFDGPSLRIEEGLWVGAVSDSGYVAAQRSATAALG